LCVLVERLGYSGILNLRVIVRVPGISNYFKVVENWRRWESITLTPLILVILGFSGFSPFEIMILESDVLCRRKCSKLESLILETKEWKRERSTTSRRDIAPIRIRLRRRPPGEKIRTICAGPAQAMICSLGAIRIGTG